MIIVSTTNDAHLMEVIYDEGDTFDDTHSQVFGFDGWSQDDSDL